MTRNSLGQFKAGDNRGEDNPNWAGGRIFIICANCGASVLKQRANTRSAKRNFCNSICKGLWQRRQPPESNPRWKGGKSIEKNGYVLARAIGHPRANPAGYVFEHILVMEKKLGEPVGREFHIHHLNRIRDDNRPENLERIRPTDHEHNTVKKLLYERIRQLEGEVARLSGVV